MLHRSFLPLLAVALVATAASAQTPAPAIPPEIATLREAYVKAFNDGDAKAVAALWAQNGEYTGADGTVIRGRAELEKSFAELFKAQPKATLDFRPESQRPLGTRVIVSEGVCQVKAATGTEGPETQYSALIVRDDDGWRLASVREWLPEPANKVTVKDLDWLVGEWVAKHDGKELKTTYSWDESKTFLNETYTLTQDGKTLASGKQIIGTNPGGGLHSWLFDRSGTTGEGLWSKDGNRWVVESSGLLPDGSETSAVNILVPLSDDHFTWQSTARTAGNMELKDLPPVKVTRVKAK